MDAAERFLGGFDEMKFKPAGPELHLIAGGQEAAGKKVPIQFGGAKEPPKPPAAPPGAPEEEEDPEKKRDEQWAKMLQEAKLRVQREMERLKLEHLQRTSEHRAEDLARIIRESIVQGAQGIEKVLDLNKILSGSEPSPKVRELEEENKVLSRLVARLYAENEQLKSGGSK